jgi:hypothetical protein
MIRRRQWRSTAIFFSGCPNQEIGWSFLFKCLTIGICSYFGADSATHECACRHGEASFSLVSLAMYPGVSRAPVFFFQRGPIFITGQIHNFLLEIQYYLQNFIFVADFGVNYGHMAELGRNWLDWCLQRRSPSLSCSASLPQTAFIYPFVRLSYSLN